MNRKTLHTLAVNGLWKQNPCLTQMLGLCPLLAISSNMVNAVMLATATLVVMALANAAVSLFRRWIPREIRIPVFILVVASLVTVVDLMFNALFHDLYLILGIFIPLITTNCIVLARVEAFAGKNPPLESTLDGIFMGIGLLWVLALLGALREFIAHGTLLGGIDLVIPHATALQILPDDYSGFLLAALPPGAFILLGFLIAGKNWLDERASRIAASPNPGISQSEAAVSPDPVGAAQPGAALSDSPAKHTSLSAVQAPDLIAKRTSRIGAVPGIARCLAAMLYELLLLLLGVIVIFWLAPHILLGALANIELPAWVQQLHFLLLLALYFVWFWLHGGQTLPMRTWKIRVVDKGGGPLRPMQALFRYLVAWFSLLFFGIGFFWRIADPERQFLHDRLAGSRLVISA